MDREALSNGEKVNINGKDYRIKNERGRGGSSIIYNAVEVGNESPLWVIKEFFPSGIAQRIWRKDEYNKKSSIITFLDGDKEIFTEMKGKFVKSERLLGNEIGERSFQIYPLIDVDEEKGLAILKAFPEDTISIRQLVDQWENSPPQLSKNYFDLGRVQYSIRIIDALLLLLENLHDSILHLDLTVNNIVWAGLDKDNGGMHSNVFLLDFGSAVKLENGEYRKKELDDYDYSCGFSAPEIKNAWVKTIKPSADIYAVGSILFFLLCRRVKDNLYTRTEYIEDQLLDLDIPKDIKYKLINMLKGICKENPDEREWQTAKELRREITDIWEAIEYYQKAHIVIREIKPLSPAYVRYSDKYMNGIQKALETTGECVVCSISGLGKSELLRQFAFECCHDKKVLEVYLPENSQKYDLNYILQSDNLFIGLRDYNDLLEKKRVFNLFLNEDSILILHNFNTPQVRFLRENLKINNKLLLSAQCTKEQLEENGIDSKSIIELKSDNDLCVSIFEKVFAQSSVRTVPDSQYSVSKICEFLYDIPLLVSLVAKQLVKQDLRKFSLYIEQLQRNGIEKLNRKNILYQKDFATQEFEGSPFEIIYKIVRTLLPKLNDKIDEQCLQVLVKMPGEFVSVEELQMILGDLPNELGFEKVYDSLEKLIDAHILQEKHDKDIRLVSIHALIGKIITSNIGEGSYISEPSLDFWEHLEKHVYVSQIINGSSYDEVQSSEILTNVKNWYLTRGELKTELNRFGSFGDGMLEHAMEYKNSNVFAAVVSLVAGNFNQPIYIELPIDNNDLFFEEVVIYYEKGIIVLKQCDENDTEYMRKFSIVMNARDQLKNTYYVKKHNVDVELREGEFCSIKLHHKVYTENTDIIIPDKFCGTPICHIAYYDNTLGDVEDSPKPYTLKIGAYCKSIVGTAFYARNVDLNYGIKMIDLECDNLREWSLPSTVEEISDKSLHNRVKKVNLLPNNKALVDKNGFIYSRDQRKLLFVPMHKRSIQTIVSQEVEEINKYFVVDAPEYHITNMSYYELEKLIIKEHFSEVEKKVLEYVNQLPLEEILKKSKELLHTYNMQVQNIEVPYYVKYFLNSSVWENEQWIKILISNWRKEENIDEISGEEFFFMIGQRKVKYTRELNPGEDFFLTMEQRKMNYIKRKLKDELFQKTNVSEFQKTYDLLLDEGIRKNILFGNIRLYTDTYFEELYLNIVKVYLLPYEKIVYGTRVLREHYECSTLGEILEKRGISNQTLLNELVDICSRE